MEVGPHVMVLGPSRDHQGNDWPLRMRRNALKELQRRGVPAVIMEDVPTIEGETNSKKFERIVSQFAVGTFLIVWPKTCRLNGLDVEIGILLGKINAGILDPSDIKIIAHEENAVMHHATGEWKFIEKGNRTHYYQDLVDEGCVIQSFKTEPHFLYNVRSAGLEHAQRHLVKMPQKDFVGQEAVKLKAKAAKPSSDGS